MLQIKTTPNLYGITLQGDYQDLNVLYDSISRYLRFYEDNNHEFYPYHQYEYLLSLNYDIRHAYMGTRRVDVIDNNAESVGVMAENVFEIPEESKKEMGQVRRDFGNGNLYFAVEILYPLVFHYLITFENILEDEPSERWFETEDERGELWKEQYTLLDANKDRAQMLFFVNLLWENLQELFGKAQAGLIYDYFRNVELIMPHSMYCDAMLHAQMANFPQLSREEKIAFLLASVYETIGAGEMEDYPDEFAEDKKAFDEALAVINVDGAIRFPAADHFYGELDKTYGIGKPIYEKEFEQFLDKLYGHIVREEPDW